MLLNELQKARRGAEAQKTALKAALQTQSAELASLKQSQQPQLAALAKLAALGADIPEQCAASKCSLYPSVT